MSSVNDMALRQQPCKMRFSSSSQSTTRLEVTGSHLDAKRLSPSSSWPCARKKPMVCYTTFVRTDVKSVCAFSNEWMCLRFVDVLRLLQGLRKCEFPATTVNSDDRSCCLRSKSATSNGDLLRSATCKFRDAARQDDQRCVRAGVDRLKEKSNQSVCMR